METKRNEENHKTFMLPFNDDEYCINTGNENFIKQREDSIQLSKLLEQMHENEERQIFNQIIITLILELLAISIYLSFFFLNDNLFEAKLQNKDEHLNVRLSFSMRSFSLKRSDRSWIINHYYCMWNDQCVDFIFDEVYHDFSVSFDDIKHISIEDCR